MQSQTNWDSLRKTSKNYTDFLIKKVRSVSGTIPDPTLSDLAKSLGSDWIDSDPQHLALLLSVGGKTTYNVRMHSSLLFFVSSPASENVFSIGCKLGFRKHCKKILNKSYYFSTLEFRQISIFSTPSAASACGIFPISNYCYFVSLLYKAKNKV